MLGIAPDRADRYLLIGTNYWWHTALMSDDVLAAGLPGRFADRPCQRRLVFFAIHYAFYKACLFPGLSFFTSTRNRFNSSNPLLPGQRLLLALGSAQAGPKSRS
jgi:hypothetical protein